jgi:hypothetical protein
LKLRAGVEPSGLAKRQRAQLTELEQARSARWHRQHVGTDDIFIEFSCCRGSKSSFPAAGGIGGYPEVPRRGRKSADLVNPTLAMLMLWLGLPAEMMTLE